MRERRRRGEGLPGFGHKLYPGGDPRAKVLLELASAAGGTARIAKLHALVTAAARSGGERPNLDLGLVAAAQALGLPGGAPTALFAVGRTAGWVAHILEQRQSSAVLRPRARYVGPEGAREPSDSLPLD